MKEKLSEAYQSLYGQIVDKDIYHMRDVEDIVSINDPSFVHEAGHKRPFYFIPDVIIDLGANISLFTGYARQLYPNALIIAVEPDRDNCEQFKELIWEDSRITLINKAIGNGNVWHTKGAANGSGENYITAGIAYPENQINKDEHYERSEIESISLSDLIDDWILNGEKFIIKMDIEGGEAAIFENKDEMKALAKADYITAEIHNFAISAETNIIIKQKTNEALDFLRKTHTVELNELNFYATLNRN